MRDSNVGKVRISDFYNLVIVIRKLLKLGIKVVQTSDELRLREISFNDDELFSEDAFNDKTAAVMLQFGGSKHLPEADLLLLFSIFPIPSSHEKP